ncbi:MAG: glutathione S-transferase [Polaribacter sp.]|jgi:glutathione S-transferase
MYTLHIANKNYSSWSLRPWVLMKELSIPFEEKISTFNKGSNWREFRVFSPSGLVPCLIDNGQIIWDSLGITEYLAERHTEIWPSKTDARAWARCAAAEMHSGFVSLRDHCPMNCGLRVRLNEISEPLQKDISRIDELWLEGLNRFKGPFLAGNKFTAIDAFYAPIAFRIRTYNLNMSAIAMNYVDLILSIESMRAWEEDALNESWRDAEHEQDSIRSGVVTEDFRRA